ALQQTAHRGRRQTLAQRRHNAAGHENVFRRHALLTLIVKLIFEGSFPRLENGLRHWPSAHSPQNRAQTGSAWNLYGGTTNYTQKSLGILTSHTSAARPCSRDRTHGRSGHDQELTDGSRTRM